MPLKKSKRSLWKKIIGAIVLLFSILIGLAHYFMDFRKSDVEVKQYFSEEGFSPVIYHEEYKGKTMRFIASQELVDTLVTVIFIHGAPGSSSDYYKYFLDKDLRVKANLVAVDRLGYGYSEFGESEVSIEEQAESIRFFLSKYKLSNTILLGHSYGGPIACSLALKYPVKAIVLLAPAISPKHEKMFFINGPGSKGPIRWILPKVFRVANDEKMAHQAELIKLLPDWERINTPIYYYHGSEDDVVPYANLSFIENRVSTEILKVETLEGEGHFLPWRNYAFVKQKLIDILDCL